MKDDDVDTAIDPNLTGAGMTPGDGSGGGAVGSPQDEGMGLPTD